VIVLKVNYLEHSDLPDIDCCEMVVVSAEGVLDIKHCSWGGQHVIHRYDFSSAVAMESSGQSPNGYADLIYRYQVDDDKLTLWLACVVPEGTPVPFPDYQEYEITTYPTYVFLAEGEQEVLPMPTGGTLGWTSALSSISYPEKQGIAVRAVEGWRESKKEINVEAQRSIDLHPKLPEHIGYWTRSTDRVIQKLFQDPTVDPLIVAKVAELAAIGPPDVGPELRFFNYLVNTLMVSYPTGPNFAATWVKTINLTSPADVVRQPLSVAVDSRGGGNDETYDLSTDYDSTDDSWIVENQPGVVTYDDDSPSLNDTVQATLSDPDGGITGRTYRWQSEVNGAWVDGPNTRSLTFSQAGRYRCRVRYTDNYASDQEAFGEVLTVT